MSLRDRIIVNIQRFAARDKQTLSTVGIASGIGQPILSKFISGRTRHLSVENLEKLATYFGTDIARLMEPIDKPLPSIERQHLDMVAERLPDTQIRVLTQTGLALLEQKKSA
jgi:transcriptional regulator with XRE-family HTH domain